MNMTKKHIKLQRYQIFASYSKHWLSWKQIRNAYCSRLTPAELNYLLCDNWVLNI